ncbi:MAG TPA: mevalonate kinase [Anaerolineae bacterium]|nr:mevalonate kinase [Anaerolineae bacterium]
MTIAYASGKAILFGEHAVVYGRPAIAVPVTQVRARATVEAGGPGIAIVAPDLNRRYLVDQVPTDDPLAHAVRITLAHLGLSLDQNLTITVASTIPLARGLGSSAAISAALVRALARHFGRDLPPEEVSVLVYETEVIHHGTPSGIDNTVVAYEQPVYFVRGQPIERLRVGAPLRLAIADTGIASSTREVVGDVRRAWERDRARYERLFDQIGEIARRARRAIEGGELEVLGRLLDENHGLLQAMGVSSPELDGLAEAARAAGALGAKLSGAGRGGNMIALIQPEMRAKVAEALREAGAASVILTEVPPADGAD